MAAGVNYTIVKRIRPMLTSLRSDIIVFTGGVAFGPAIKELLEAELDVRVVVPPYPQLNGAVGCAVHGRDSR